MKVATRVVAIVAVLVAASAANAATHIWFAASNPAGGAAIQTAGAAGQSTALRCDATAAFCTWTITMAYQNDAGDTNLASWANDLFMREQVSGKISIDTGSVVYASNNFTAHPAPVTYGNGPMLEQNASGFDFGAGGSGGNLATFTLRKVKNGSGSTNTDHIYVQTGGLEWGTVDGANPDMQAGSNPTVASGGAGGTDLGDVITITNFPEPTSLVLLGLGAVALIRRRR